MHWHSWHSYITNIMTLKWLVKGIHFVQRYFIFTKLMTLNDLSRFNFVLSYCIQTKMMTLKWIVNIRFVQKILCTYRSQCWCNLHLTCTTEWWNTTVLLQTLGIIIGNCLWQSGWPEWHVWKIQDFGPRSYQKFSGNCFLSKMFISLIMLFTQRP